MTAAALQTESPEVVYQRSAEVVMQERVTQSPDWLQDVRLQAFSRFKLLGFPTRRLEAWKYINLRPVLAMPLQNQVTTAPKVCPPALQRHLLGMDDASVIRLVFINGRYHADLSIRPTVERGIVIESLKEAIQQQTSLVEPYLAAYRQEESDALAALNTALFEDGVFVYLPDHTEVPYLLQLVYVNFDEERRATHPRNLFVLGQKAKASMVIEHLGLSQAVCFNNSVNEFVLNESAQMDCTMILSEGPQGWHLANTVATLQANARLSMNTVTFSGLVNRHSIRPIIKGEGAHVSLNGLDVLDGKSEVYHHTVAEHWVPNGVSEQLYKAILDDDSKSEFNSLVFVAKDAIGTDSHQLNKALLLSPNAHVWTRPQLQINTDDVKCAHGAAVGQLDETQLFYLASRGLNRELAQSLLTYGFAEDIIQRIPNPKIRQYLDGRVLNNLHRLDSGPGASLKKQLGA
jgi:Fe-S cluster assembly protein SufD